MSLQAKATIYILDIIGVRTDIRLEPKNRFKERELCYDIQTENNIHH